MRLWSDTRILVEVVADGELVRLNVNRMRLFLIFGHRPKYMHLNHSDQSQVPFEKQKRGFTANFGSRERYYVYLIYNNFVNPIENIHLIILLYIIVVFDFYQKWEAQNFMFA